MSLSISQILAVSYSAVLAEKRKPANQWAESSMMKALEDQGAIKRISLGPTIEAPLDYRANPGTAFLSTDLQPTSMSKTEVITAASYTPAELSVPIVWSKRDDALNPTENQKVALVGSLLDNGFTSHDDAIESALFTTSTNGFLGFLTHMTSAGTGSDGGIDSGVETWWANQQATYIDDTDIEAAMTTVYEACAKGSGSSLLPTLLGSDGATRAIFEGTQQAQQRWSNTSKLNAGFTDLQFKNATYAFSPHGTSSIFFMNPKNLQIVVSREYFRDRGETQEIQNANGFVCKIYSALQCVTNNRSRLGVVHL